ncbi:MAG: hypothetical protein ABIH52_04820 [Candidatus Aenigmatarchaeota archaeon]
MSVIELPEIVASHGELFEFGTYRIREYVTAGKKTRIAIPGYTNKIMFIYEFKFGDLTANAFNFRWDLARNVVERDLLLGDEQINFVTRPFPLIIIKEKGAAIFVENTSGQDAYFEMSFDYFLTVKEFVERLEKFVHWKDII